MNTPSLVPFIILNKFIGGGIDEEKKSLAIINLQAILDLNDIE